MGVASGSVLLARVSEVLSRQGVPLKERSWAPSREIQSFSAAFLSRRAGSSAVGRQASGSRSSWFASKSSPRCASTAHLGASESTAALPSTLVESKNSSSPRSEEHTSELQSRQYLECRLLLENKITQLTNLDLGFI